ncbi:adenosine deaminase, partial [Streptomyces sp. TRM76130]|nr:adenosine deaminase [Streptomyces sp. TRM76130]
MCDEHHVRATGYRDARLVRQDPWMERVRDVSELPKAHLHLHFTGSMRPATLLELADKHGVRLPDAL